MGGGTGAAGGVTIAGAGAGVARTGGVGIGIGLGIAARGRGSGAGGGGASRMTAGGACGFAGWDGTMRSESCWFGSFVGLSPGVSCSGSCGNHFHIAIP